MFKIVLLALAASLGLRMETGQAAYYAEGVMERVVRVRQAGWTAGPLPAQIPKGIWGYIAVPECDKIGNFAWIFWAEDSSFEGPFLIADCANQTEGHDELMRKKNIVIEVDFNTAKRRQILGYGPEHNHVALILKYEN